MGSSQGAAPGRGASSAVVRRASSSHQALAPLAVPRLERGEQRAMLVTGAQAAAAGAGAERDKPRALAVIEQPCDDQRGATVAGRGGDADVNRPVGVHEALDRGRVVEVESGLGEGAKVGDLVGGDPAGGGRGGGRLEEQAQVVDLQHVAYGERRDDVAAPRLGEHETLGAQTSERGPDGGLGEAETSDQLCL
jgi:hypothetical protein